MDNSQALSLLRTRYAQAPQPDDVLLRLIDIGEQLDLDPLRGEVLASTYVSASSSRQYFDITLPALRRYGARHGVRGAAIEWIAEDGAAHRAWFQSASPIACVATVTPSGDGLPRVGVARLELCSRYLIAPTGLPALDPVWTLRAPEKLAEVAEKLALLALFPEVETALEPTQQRAYNGPPTLSATEAAIAMKESGAPFGSSGNGMASTSRGSQLPPALTPSAQPAPMVPPPQQRAQAPVTPPAISNEPASLPAIPEPAAAPVSRPPQAPPPQQRPPVGDGYPRRPILPPQPPGGPGNSRPVNGGAPPIQGRNGTSGMQAQGQGEDEPYF